ncbi:sugar kinase [Streptomyces sp. NPDC057638]|uniref:sugar kinase n=1 Tax=Streptomyces sp. NPDC057638 TaxID=3346190 RepID=UPI0036768B29
MDPTTQTPLRSPRVSSLTGSAGESGPTGRAAERSAADGRVDVVCLGESMVTFRPSHPGRLADVPSFHRGIGGAESNVACALAALGHRVRWISRVGTDGFGDHLVTAIAGYGVDTSAVGRDPARPTGIYFRTATDRATDAHEVVYYRRGSAASAMSPGTMAYEEVTATRILHVSGITAALSDDCRDLMRQLTERRPGRPLVSFDVNHRPKLWRDGSGPRTLLELARGADLVFVGEDEAEDAWDIHGVEAVRAALPEPETVVVKQGGRGATVFERAPGTGADTVTFVPAPGVEVVAPVGAGDAFAAGYLSAHLGGADARERLRRGHLTAAATLTVAEDLATPPPAALTDRLVALDDGAWERLRLVPGWSAASGIPPVGKEEEVRTP